MAKSTQYVIEPPARPTVRVLGAGDFPVRRVLCIGRNYADHVAEMGGRPERNPPTFFTKPADAVRCEPGEIPYAMATHDLHHEVEWVVALYRGGRNLSPEQTAELVGASGVGLDMTRRDLQGAAKKAGDPWDAGKAFDDSAPISALRAGSLDSVAPDTVLSLQVNGVERQRATIAHLIWSVPELLSELSTLYELRPGDLVFTGTPAGVGPVQPGDVLDARLEGIAQLSVRIGAAAPAGRA